ncbi:LytR/AlgR family response regulator transcription factor [Alloscardovia sp. HMSC034E08]|uniref:LytR/AlgR family response regulator transcription factor n=1 Tax=Alloscardovia sp. HMSC034E08 TaxID=1739413 RepID=UPI0008B262E7|nr:LytTR family DNA-binding domain-containing protein [Alloscardovia sp. HMSC034E08]OFQ97052.1 hypothetical protein HMPREF2909_00825 [Alloscardovia sp. HMSC034E08]
MRLALVDDDAEIRSLLRAYVQRYNTEYGTSISTYDFTRGSDLLHNYERGVFDVIFLDIEMPGISGMETATQIRRIDDAVALVFVTHLAQFAVQGYEVQASDYIIKPLSYFDFAMKITRILKTIEGKTSTVLAITTTDGLRSINLADVSFLEARDHYVFISTVHGAVYKVRDSMTNQSRVFEQYGFLRVHKSFAVNMKHIEAIYTTEIICAGRSIPIGRSYKKDVQPAFLAYVGGQ